MQKFSDSQKHLYLTQLFCHPLLQLLPNTVVGQQARDELTHRVILHKYPKNSLIFLQHTPADNLYFLLDGQVNCYRNLPNGQEYLIKHYQELNLINESVLWQHQNTTITNSYAIAKSPTSKNVALLLNQGSLHQLTAKVTQSATVASIPASLYFDQIKAFELGELFVWFASHMSKQLYKLLIRNDLLTFHSAKAKVSYYLLTHFLPNQPFHFTTNQKQLANQMGLRAETLNRTLHHLTKQNFIQQIDNQYMIVNIDGLLALINE